MDGRVFGIPGKQAPCRSHGRDRQHDMATEDPSRSPNRELRGPPHIILLLSFPSPSPAVSAERPRNPLPKTRKTATPPAPAPPTSRRKSEPPLPPRQEWTAREAPHRGGATSGNIFGGEQTIPVSSPVDTEEIDKRLKRLNLNAEKVFVDFLKYHDGLRKAEPWHAGGFIPISSCETLDRLP